MESSTRKIRNLRALALRIRRRQQQSVPVAPFDTTEHCCQHCGCHFTGRYCPQCSMPAPWQRFTAKRLLMGFFDIWGMGNRPMFRSIRDLFWRPGYMVRDYLSGHHLAYFPPFKMLAVVTMLLALVAWLLGVGQSTGSSLLEILQRSDETPPERLIPLVRAFDGVVGWLQTNTLYRILAQNVVLVFAVWIVFRRKSQYNLVETFFSQIYINCQFQLLTILWLICFGSLDIGALFPYAVPSGLCLLVLFYDYRQLYGLRFCATLWRTLLVGLVLALIYVVLILLTAVSATIYLASGQ